MIGPFNPQALRRYLQHGHRQYIDLGSDAPPPDPLIGQSARMSAETAAEALSFYKNTWETDIKPRQARLDALTTEVTNQQLSDQRQASQFSAEQRQEYRDTYLPVERQSAADAMGYDSEPNVNRRMGIASANVTQAFSNARQTAVNELSKYGLSPSSPAFAAAMRRLTTQEAVTNASARTGAAYDTMDKGIALRAGVAQTGRGLTNTSAQFLAGSTSAGSAATGAAQGAAQVGNQGAQVGGSGYGVAIQGYGTAASAMNTQYSNQVQAAGQNPLLEAIGAGVGLYGAIKSSKKFKDRNESLEGDDVLGKVRSMKVDRWGYKGDQQLHVGPYAEELHQKFGVGDGTTIGPTDVGGVALAAVKQLADKVDKIGQKFGLSMEEV